MKRTASLSSILLVSWLLALGACDADDPCAEGSCDEVELDETSEPLPPQAPIPCRPACEALFGDCGESEAGDSTMVKAMAACIDWCEAGGLSQDEAECLDSTGCAGVGDACLSA